MQTFNEVFERALGVDDRKKNLPFEFEVPSGTTQVWLHLTYSPHKVEGINNMLTLTLFDPQGFRGEGHRHGDDHRVMVSPQSATPGYFAGPVTAGRWTVVVNTQMIMPGPPCMMRLEVGGTDDAAGEPPLFRPDANRKIKGPGWYRGDLHAHSNHSDAHWTIQEMLAYGREHNFDFMTLTDHNTVTGLPEMEAASTGDLLTMVGMELTTFWGHALALGLHTWTNWHTRTGKRDMLQIASEVQAAGGFFVIAHPRAVGDPICTGCRWVYREMMPGCARIVEVWNDDWSSESNNPDALELVYEWMNRGLRLALTAGSDNHGPLPIPRHYGYNVVYAQALSQPEILRAVAAGRSYISAGPKLSFEAVCGSQRAGLGGVLHAGAGDAISLSAQWSGCSAGEQVDLIVDGMLRDRQLAGADAGKTWQLQGGRDHWAMVTLQAPGGKMMAITNPIYFDGRE